MGGRRAERACRWCPEGDVRQQRASDGLGAASPDAAHPLAATGWALSPGTA